MTLREYRQAINEAARREFPPQDVATDDVWRQMTEARRKRSSLTPDDVDAWLRERSTGAPLAVILQEAIRAYPQASWGQLVYTCYICGATPPIADGVDLPCEWGCWVYPDGREMRGYEFTPWPWSPPEWAAEAVAHYRAHPEEVYQPGAGILDRTPNWD